MTDIAGNQINGNVLKIHCRFRDCVQSSMSKKRKSSTIFHRNLRPPKRKLEKHSQITMMGAFVKVPYSLATFCSVLGQRPFKNSDQHLHRKKCAFTILKNLPGSIYTLSTSKGKQLSKSSNPNSYTCTHWFS